LDPRIERLKSATFFIMKQTRRKIAQIREMVQLLPGNDRRELARTICERLRRKRHPAGKGNTIASPAPFRYIALQFAGSRRPIVASIPYTTQSLRTRSTVAVFSSVSCADILFSPRPQVKGCALAYASAPLIFPRD